MIVDNDGGIATVGVRSIMPKVPEAANTTAAFVLTRTGGNIARPDRAAISVMETRYQAGDYVTLPGEVTFASGAAEAVVNLRPIDDALGELDESVGLYLPNSRDTSYLVDNQNNTAETVIVDDDGGIATVGIAAAAPRSARRPAPRKCSCSRATGGNLNAALSSTIT